MNILLLSNHHIIFQIVGKETRPLVISPRLLVAHQLLHLFCAASDGNDFVSTGGLLCSSISNIQHLLNETEVDIYYWKKVKNPP